MAREGDTLIASYTHLKDLSRSKDALHTLKKIASMVKPIMRARGWHVKTLAEFYPKETNLLGLNIDHGSKICLRLRHAGDKDQFLPWDNVLDTMLHELCHNAIGPHNAEFHKLWDSLREEAEGLLMKGYTGEGFLGEGKRLGGSKRLPPQEARRLARQAAADRAKTGAGLAGPGHRLGGKAVRPTQDIRKVIADAAQRRNQTMKGCASESLNDRQIRDLADTATRNGFRTKAEEDEANEIAIAQAMWELVQEDEKIKYGDNYVQPTPQNPAGLAASSFVPTSPSLGHQPGPSDGASSSSSEEIWVCGVCTLHNPRNFLACDACGSERSGEQAQEMLRRAEERRAQPTTGPTAAKSRSSEVVDLTASPPRKRDEKRRRFAEPVDVPSVLEPPAYWHCQCGNRMERKWWTCSLCGRMKQSSA